MPRVEKVLETSLYVEDLARSARFYRSVLGFSPMLEDGRLTALDTGTGQVVLLFRRGGSETPSPVPGGVIPPHGGEGRLHLAFAIAAESLDWWTDQLARNGVPIESVVRPERGGTSLYFRDPDGHLIELATPGIWPTY
jgi:catechol 2,3-dioxygenase-like lactoylglutathione lyase family enzyme